MSLIDEALKRARMEAARKAAESEGLPYPTIPRHLAPRRRGWPLPAMVALAVLVGVAVGVLLASRGGSPAARVTEQQLATEAAPTASPQMPAVAVEPAQPGESGSQPVVEGPLAPTSPLVGTTESTPSPAPAPRPRATRPPTKPLAERVEPAPEVAPPTATTVTDPDSGMLLVLPDRQASAVVGAGPRGTSETPAESYEQQVPLPGGGTIELGGIAWSETGPFALINGRVVGPGAVIEGYTLERIGPGHVELTGDGRRILLSLQ